MDQNDKMFSFESGLKIGSYCWKCHFEDCVVVLYLIVILLFSELMAEASLPYAKRLKLSEPMVKYCIHMMDKYGEDYKVCNGKL